MAYNPVANPAEPTPRLASFEEETLQPPAGFRDSGNFRDSYGAPSNASFDSAQPFGAGAANMPYRDDPSSSANILNKEDTGYPPSPPMEHGSTATRKKKTPVPWIIAGVAGLAIVVVAVVVPIYFTVIKKNNDTAASQSDHTGSNTGSNSGSNNGNDPGTTKGAITGADGSTVTMEDGTTFTYSNKFGGFWVQDPDDPFNGNAQAQSWSPPLNQSWDWQNNKIRGVNLGGWLVPEPFIAPALYEPYMNLSTPAIDEWTLSENMAADTANGGLDQLEKHYQTFITEKDFAAIAGAGLNWVRLPIPFWAIQKYDNEPFLEGVAWKYVLKAFSWARKYGIRINLDLHALPGSQNGYNHSGKRGSINFLSGVMGIANAERGLDYIRILTEFISQDEYKNLVPLFGVINEARTADIGMDVIGSFYVHMHDVLRNVTGLGEGNGPYLSIHDGFQNLANWADFMPGKDRFALDTHPYMCFTGVDTTPLAQQIRKPCRSWAAETNTSWSEFGVTTAGEWSLAINDCGRWINGVGAGTRYEGTLNGYSGTTGGDGPQGCLAWNDWEKWDDTTKANLKEVALSSMDALQNWFFWTWKIGASSISGKVESPFWSYSLGLENGWIPTDPREAAGVCGGTSPASALKPSMTGGPGSGQISAAWRNAHPWPPATLAPSGYNAAELPTYTPTGPIPVLPTPTFTDSKGQAVKGGNGWFNAQDTDPVYTPVAGCTYPDQWDAVSADIPSACSGSRRVRNVIPQPKRTPPPS
ncbi:hypothetical protein FS837_007377 [Tulasnella sp. UAMH 9824]|nr:hypothetical protein FS837_007377 [Tulasnella sp. UAMH 9824]